MEASPNEGASETQSSASSEAGRREFLEIKSEYSQETTAGKLRIDFTQDRVLPTTKEMLQNSGVGIKGRWKEAAGNFVIYPTDVEINPPKGVIHFLGGAFVGAAPHITYRYLLDSLCNEGYIVVTTPYRLDFDYIPICQDIVRKFDKVSADISSDFGALPVIGIGHSCGAFFQTLITSLFPAVPRKANVLIAWNNKPVTEAIPMFDELVVPLSQQLMGTSDSAQDSAAGMRDVVSGLRAIFDSALEGVKIDASAPSVVKEELVPAVQQGLELIDQVPNLLSRIASGTKEFTPSPEKTREAARENYNARRTLIIQFDGDEIDESPDVKDVLDQARLSRLEEQPSAEIEVKLVTIEGTHVTPLTQNVIIEPPDELTYLLPPDPLFPLRKQVRENFLQTVNEVKAEIMDWL